MNPTREQDHTRISTLVDELNATRDAWLVTSMKKDGSNAAQVLEQQAMAKYAEARGALVDAFLTLGDCLRGAEALRQLQEAAVPFICDGKEQEAFETHAKNEGHDMTQHPLHYLFLNDRTKAARAAWRDALVYVRQVLGLPRHPSG